MRYRSDLPVRILNFSTNRFTLDFKGLPYKTVWVEYPDIRRTCQEMNISPTGTWPDGTPMYTLPALVDPSTGTALADSAAIARYLDAAYPATSRAFPPGTEAFHAAFQAALDAALAPHVFYIGVPAGYERLSAVSRAHFKEARQRVLGGRMEDWNPVGSPERARNWAALETGLGKVAAWMAADGKERTFVMGDEPCYADFVIGARLMWLKRGFGEESEDWRRIEGWHGGKWARFLAALGKISDTA